MSSLKLKLLLVIRKMTIINTCIDANGLTMTNLMILGSQRIILQILSLLKNTGKELVKYQKVSKRSIKPIKDY